MPPKPESCQGCPLYGQSKTYVTDRGQAGSPVLVLAPYPSQESEGKGEAFHPESSEGRNLRKYYLPLARLTTDDVTLGYALRCRPVFDKQVPLLGGKEKVLEQALEHCQRAHESSLEGKRLIVAMGDEPLYQQCGLETKEKYNSKGGLKKTVAPHKTSEWRGWLLPHKTHQIDSGSTICTPQVGQYPPPVLSTYTNKDVAIRPEMQLPSRMDWVKVGRYLRGEWPNALGEIIDKPFHIWPSVCSYDTEFTYPGPKRLLRINVATPDRRVWVIEAENVKKYTLVKPVKIIAHNWIADLGFLRQQVGPEKYIQLEDTMYMNSVLWSGMAREKDDDSRKGLGLGQGLDFLGSMYASINRWKHLSLSNPRVYAAGDAVATLDVWDNLQAQFAQDVQSEWIYRNCVLPLLPIIYEAEERGMKVNRARAREVAAALEERTRQAELKAQAYVGWPILMSSAAQVGHQLYGVEGVK